jgi:amidase
MTDLAFRSATELAADIRARRIGCRELLDHYVARIERYNPALNAVIAMDLERARRRADEADAALARGENWGPLHGIPMTVKESYDVEGFVTSWGAPEFKDYRPSRNAICVDRLLAAGANIFGKTNVPLFLGDLQTHNQLYGTTRSPWDLDRTPGGSSGGAAAALAAGLTALEAGSDIASSIRTPAHYCGLYGHKPTYGVITTRGQLVPGRVAFSDLAVIGPMARSAADLALALNIMAGPDEVDGSAWRLTLPKPRKQRLAEYRIGVMLDVSHAEVDLAVQEQIRQVADAVAKAGGAVSFSARPDIDTVEADQLFHRVLGAALSGRQSDEVFGKNVAMLSTLPPGDTSTLARTLRAATLSHREWLIANEARHRMRLKWATFFEDYDLLLCPAAATVAPVHNHEGDPFERPITVNGRQVPLSSQFFWAGYSGLALLPSTVAPAGMTPQGLPVGVQIIGPQYGDLTCIHFAGLLEQSYRKFVPPPGY